jgi:hypothetical protein
MCQSKSQGGKRCAIHHHGTQAAVQTTSVKTGVDTNDVKTVFTELNKEGKKLPEPSREEYESYLEKERFITELDPSIPERDKNMILKKIEKAKEENTPSGGTFHAWKNLMSTTINRFKTKTKLLIAGLGVAAITFGSAGCASVLPNQETGLPIEGTTSISVIDGEKINDELGSYTKVTLDPNDPSLKFDKNAEYVDMASIENSGFTEADAAAAQKAAIMFASTEMIDNAAADIPAKKAETLSNIVNQYATGPYINSTEYVEGMLDANSNLVYVQPDGITFVRDGSKRISSVNTKINGIYGETGSGDGLSAIHVVGATVVDYKVNQSGAGAGYKTAQVESWFELRMVPDGSGAWKILGYNNSFETSLIK